MTSGGMNFSYSDRQLQLIGRVKTFMRHQVLPAVEIYEQQLEEGGRWRHPAIVDELKRKARAEGLWNLFWPKGHEQDPYCQEGLTNLDYAPLAEEMGRVIWASEVFNCSAPDTGNMEVLLRFGSPVQQERWLKPLAEGAIRSAFAMTEPDVASSDASNVATSIVRDRGEYVINGRKWWISGLGDPRCKIIILLGRTNPDAPSHRQQTQILIPADSPGVTVVRKLPVFGYDDAPHGHVEVTFDNVRVPAENVILGEGRGFEIAQGRLGPGRIHHCMRAIGLAEEALERMVRRLLGRTAFGRTLASQSLWEQRVAEARTEIEMTRLLCLKAADMMDKHGNKIARAEIAMIKVAGPRMALKVVDDAIQAHGAGGLTTDFGLAKMYARARGLRIADGPDEVHNRTIARLEYRRYSDTGNNRPEPH